MIIHYAEVTEKNGLIVLLDQEKAYDKIRHDYLWKVLEKFNFPQEYITTIKNIYKPAKTYVMINGCKSNRFAITRGVRQGDPLSCLIFDLAIEPLAAMLRDSNLKGYQIPGATEKLIANLFADDTTTFLDAEDDFETLQGILDKWCLASGARFNLAKTQIIPIGRQEYWNNVIQTRKTTPNKNPLPDQLHIAADGEASRILGAWFGNRLDTEQVWVPILEKIDANLERWTANGLTMEGRRHVVQMIIGGMTQYLTVVQGMPKSIEKKLTKRVKTFM